MPRQPDAPETWWHRASTEQKLAQIDGGIECGMTARQVGLASGRGLNVAGWAVASVARRHGRAFPDVGKGNERVRAGIKRRGDIGRDRRAFLAGDRVDFFSAQGPSDEFMLDEAEQ